MQLGDPRDAPPRPLGRGLLGAVVVWLLLAVGGMWLLLAYSFAGGTAAQAAPPPSGWPGSAAIARAPGVPTLVVVLHPKCPCSRATVAELARLLTHAPRKVDTHVLIVRPPGTPEGWEQTDLWSAAAAIPGVSVQADPRGTEAARFGAQTSGHAFLFDEVGTLLFEGGITSARGHEGDSDGQDAILAALAHAPARAGAPVFGCKLNDPRGRLP